MRKIITLGLLVLVGWFVVGRDVHAQTAGSTQPPTMQYVIVHTSCVAATGVTLYCFASDGFYISVNGGTLTQVQMGATVAGVTSFNGQTGSVVYTPPVVSVNGKTGAVVLGVTLQ